MQNEITCWICRTKFYTTFPNARYCSAECKKTGNLRNARDLQRKKRAKARLKKAREGYKYCANCLLEVSLEKFRRNSRGQYNQNCTPCLEAKAARRKEQAPKYPLREWITGRRSDLTEIELDMIKDDEYGGDSTCWSCVHLRQCRERVRKSWEENKEYLTQCMF